MKAYKSSGESLDFTVGSEAVTSGDLVALNNSFFGVAQSSGGTGDTVACLRSGRFDLKCTAGLTGNAGDPVYFDGGAKGVSVVGVGNKVGYLASALGAAATTADCVLVPDTASVWGEGVAEFDVAQHGGSGSIEFGNDLPKGCIVTECWIRVETTFTSATDAATIALGIKTDDAACFDAAIAISAGGNPWDQGLRISDVNGESPSGQTTAARKFLATIAGGEDLTAGRLQLYYRYFVPATS